MKVAIVFLCYTIMWINIFNAIQFKNTLEIIHQKQINLFWGEYATNGQGASILRWDTKLYIKKVKHGYVNFDWYGPKC